MNNFFKIVIVYITFLITTCCFGQENLNFIKLDKTFSWNSQIVEDQNGFIIISTNQGLYKYNGYNFTLIPFESLFDENYNTDKEYKLSKDKNGNFWISTFKGELTRFGTDGTTYSFKKELSTPQQITTIKPNKNQVWFGSANGNIYKYNSKTIDSVTTLPKMNGLHQSIKSIAFSGSDEIWMSTINGKIYYYSLSKNILNPLNNSLFDKKQNITITNDKNGRIWFATELDGLFSYKIDKSGIFKQYDRIQKSENNIKHHMFISIFCDSQGKIWAGTDGDGLYSINTIDGSSIVYKHEENNKFSVSNNTINYINEDSKGNLWIVDKKGLINILPNRNTKINYYNGLESNIPSTVLSILKSSDGTLYIGTDGKGLTKISPKNKKVQFNLNKKGKFYFKGRYPQSLVEDNKGNIWIGTYQEGLWVYNPRTNAFTKINTSKKNGSYSSDIRTVFKDSKNRIWVTTDNALDVFSDNLNLLASFDYNSKGLFGNNSMAICEDENGVIWFGINPSTLYRFNEDQEDFKNSYFTKQNYFVKDQNDLKNYNIHDLEPDKNGHLWILIAAGKLIKYNIAKSSFESFADRDHFKDVSIRSILIDDPNNLWLSSSNGIHHYNLMSDTFTSYYEKDGLQSNLFSRRSSFKDENGRLYFGSDEGVNSFLPEEMSKTETNAKLFINAIEILNKPADIIIPEQIKNSVENVKELKLNYDQSSFSFQFSAIDNVLHTNFRYAYKLNGFDNEWISPNESRIASYTNIPYGNYTFEVKAGSKRGEWNINPVAINIRIKPPLWHHPIAYILYFIIAFILIYGFTLWLRLKNKLAEETWQNNKEKELYALKMNFFAKMSHEIQTPLTLILGPIDDMINRAKTTGNSLLIQRLQMISNNANRLSRIATELMTLRNKELGKLRLYASKNNLIEHIKKITLSFSEQARFKKIDIIENYPKDKIELWYDLDKIEHVIYNLISNAFKFTPKEGSVTITVTQNLDKELIQIAIKDDGPGIPKDDLDNIFKLFYQSDLGKRKKGIGVGLALTKELVSLHHGKINVTSSSEEGTCFSFTLSTNESLLNDDEKIIIKESNKTSNSLIKNYNKLENYLNKKSKSKSTKESTLLIVEDNIEMQIFLQDMLEENYNLLIAGNGKEGINLAVKNNPDLVISDIMMPGMDGIEMCKVLKKNKSTSHIPVILLTAKNTSNVKIKSFESGAIQFIQKPFNFYELALKINNTLEEKKKVLENYEIEKISSSQNSNHPSKDSIFMNRLVSELDARIDNPNFKLEDLTEALNMSYSVIYRKCLEITGKTLVEFVRLRRLKKAALLIIKSGFNVSEAGYMVGYKDSRYFTKCFKNEFGVTPNNFRRMSKKSNFEDFIKKYDLQ